MNSSDAGADRPRPEGPRPGSERSADPIAIPALARTWAQRYKVIVTSDGAPRIGRWTSLAEEARRDL